MKTGTMTLGQDGYIEGQMLVATPGMPDPRFEKSVIYMCAHSEQGAMGLMVNKVVEHITFTELLEQLEIAPGGDANAIRVHFGGPVETGRGFVLHSDDYVGPESNMNNEAGIGLTATVDILRAMASGRGPRRSLVALGYAGWMPGQLEQELRSDGWLVCPPDPDILFAGDDAAKWETALRRIGIDPALLSGTQGSA
ncbi:YqgE/AlgH family protein [Futiania mangrovi]|uniref:UPF0301 protein NJQ99_14350 n=1 Tax=Futiania mangrovi TaxID=2959716 RepID=A0A9J6PIG8_9PROT|nr:YqgE/AlgH family protein [Futiania mangrovii]MCP1337600.1 YqgE/AlgH family protein [Futiania mangrovii]